LHRAYDAPIDCFVITSRTSLSARLPPSGDGRIPAFVERAWLGDDHPCCPSDLRRERDSDLVHVHPALQGVEPPTETVPRSIKVGYAGACPVDQQPPDIAIAAFADSKERGLAAG